MRGNIDANLLKSQVCESKRRGVPTEELGHLLISLVTKVAGRFYERGPASHPVEYDEAKQIVLLKCVETIPTVNCRWTARKCFNYYSTFCIHRFVDLYRSHYRGKAAFQKFAAEKGAETSPN